MIVVVTYSRSGCRCSRRHIYNCTWVSTFLCPRTCRRRRSDMGHYRSRYLQKTPTYSRLVSRHYGLSVGDWKPSVASKLNIGTRATV